MLRVSWERLSGLPWESRPYTCNSTLGRLLTSLLVMKSWATLGVSWAKTACTEPAEVTVPVSSTIASNESNRDSRPNQPLLIVRIM